MHAARVTGPAAAARLGAAVALCTGRGWPTLALLAAAYALFEEGPIDRMLWNRHHGAVDMGAA
ncbi:hypothetical protein ACH4SK_27560 [Streptomyces inhibens]|uniref:hypothetical protein n=1 Tax=Streptomyces inhibens TaxID=2293571 RepID=UPI0037B37BC6